MKYFVHKWKPKEVELDVYPVRVTWTISSMVRVIFLSINATIVDDELESVVHKTSIASLVVWSITIHQFLLWQRDQLTGHNLVYPFHCTNGWERPATPFNPKHINSITKKQNAAAALHEAYQYLCSQILYSTQENPICHNPKLKLPYVNRFVMLMKKLTYFIGADYQDGLNQSIIDF